MYSIRTPFGLLHELYELLHKRFLSFAMMYSNELMTLFENIIIIIMDLPNLFTSLIDFNDVSLLDYPFGNTFMTFTTFLDKLRSL